jgi:hypothetical protein
MAEIRISNHAREQMKYLQVEMKIDPEIRNWINSNHIDYDNDEEVCKLMYAMVENDQKYSPGKWKSAHSTARPQSQIKKSPRLLPR